MRLTQPEEIYQVFTPVERALLAIESVRQTAQRYADEWADDQLHDDEKFDPYEFVDTVRSILETHLPETVFAEMVAQSKLEEVAARLNLRLQAYANHTEIEE